MACFDAWDIGACGCSVPTFNVTFVLHGCLTTPHNTALFSGFTIHVYDYSGGTLLVSGTTGAGGSVVLAIPGAPGAYYYVTVPAYNARWTNFGASLFLYPATFGIALPTNTASYVCCSNIDIPIHKALSYTDANGTATITFTSACNTQNFKYASPAISPINPSCNATTGATAILRQISQSGANTLSVNRTWYGILHSGSPGYCYCDYSGLCGGGGTGLEMSQTYLITSIAVPLTFTVALTLTTNPAGYPPDPMVTLGQSISVTVSE
jgi:hypothetical protein